MCVCVCVCDVLQSVCLAFLVLWCFLSWNCWLVSEKLYELFVMCHTMGSFVKLSIRRMNRWDVSVSEQCQLIATIAKAIKINYIPFSVLRVCNIDFLSHKLDGKCEQKWVCKRNIFKWHFQNISSSKSSIFSIFPSKSRAEKHSDGFHGKHILMHFLQQLRGTFIPELNANRSSELNFSVFQFDGHSIVAIWKWLQI